VSAARKPVIVRKLSRDWCAGYASANPSGDQELELLDASGKLVRIEWSQIKWVCYVRELPGSDSPSPGGNDSANPERLIRRHFSGRPRISGLWLRLTLADGEELEGVVANDRSLIDGAGLLLTPPDTRSNTQRVFIPRQAMRELTVVAVIGATSPGRPHRQPGEAQPELFGSIGASISDEAEMQSR
jgi:hypothetical protein